jgi:hypothetical protein
MSFHILQTRPVFREAVKREAEEDWAALKKKPRLPGLRRRVLQITI